MAEPLAPPPDKSAIAEADRSVGFAWLRWFRAVRDILVPLIGRITIGSGDPTGVVVADVGSIFLRTDGAAGTTIWIKEADSGLATGWVSK